MHHVVTVPLRLVAFALAIPLLLSFPTPLAAQTCEGDCNNDRQVVINELIVGVRIALGDGAVGDCQALDRDGDGQVSINELIAAVTRALQGCAGQIDESALVASARVAVEPITRIINLGSAAAGGAGAVGSLARAGVGRPAGSSGCETFDCFLFGEFTGSVEICCLDGQYTFTAFQCTFDDELGNVISQDGFFSLRSDDPSVCAGSVPPGVSFESTTEGFFFSVEDPTGSFIVSSSDLVETFAAVPAGCTDELGFGVFGDGTRLLDGERQDFAGDGFGSILLDEESIFAALQIEVASAQNEQGCAVGVRLNGGQTATDFITASQFSVEYSEFQVIQVPSGNALALTVDGTVSTDCIGDVALSTVTPLRLAPGDACLSGGRLDATLDGGAVAVTFTAGGGVELDFGPDGSVDQRFASCEDIVSDECTAQPVAGLCAACSDDLDCSGELGCFDCAFNCTGSTSRCSFFDDFATCDDGVF